MSIRYAPGVEIHMPKVRSKASKKKSYRYGKKVKFVAKKARPSTMVRARGRRQVCFIPNSFVTTHTYSKQIDWALAAAANTTQYFYGNSLSHCYNNTITEQAFGFDQLGALYKKYFVYKASIRVSIVPTTEVPNVLCGLMSDMDMNTVPTFTGYYDVVEKSAKSKILTGTNIKPVTFSLVRTTKSQNIKNDDNGQGTYDATTAIAPSDKWGYRIACYNNSSSTSAIKVYVKIIYYARWMEPQEQSGST